MDFLKHFSYIRFQKAENAKLSYFVKKFNEFMDLLFKGVKKTKQNCVARWLDYLRKKKLSKHTWRILYIISLYCIR